MTNQTGAVVSRHDYLPFGWELYSGLTGRTSGHGYLTSPEGVPTPTQRFTGKERDSESRLDYFGARYYSAGPGRFTSADAPFADQHTDDPQSWNLYSYVRNNPLAFVDSTGRCLHPYQAAQCGVGLGQRRMTPKEAENTAKGVAIGTAAVATGAAAPSLISWGGAIVRSIFGWALRNPVVATEVAVGAVEAGIGLEGPSTHRLIPTGDVDDAARALAKKLGGTASVMIEGLGNREFDTVSKEFVAQTFGSANALLKPDSFLSKTRREQIRATLSAAKETGRKAYFEFRAGVHDDVLDFIKRNAERVGVEYQVSK